MMIKPNELRIGNYFLCQLEVFKDKEVCCAFWLTEDGVVNQHKGFCPYDASYPIPITPEWLERLGFEYRHNHNADGDEIEWLEHPNMTGISYRNGAWHRDLGTIELPVKYVHQLQNLYYALTGEELAI